MNSLKQQNEVKARRYIDLIDSLRSLGLEKELALPAIAVIGDQSSGKSSVLEALSGVALPRGSGFVEKCPLELKMKRKKKGEEWDGTISRRSNKEEINNPADVDKKIRNARAVMAGFGWGVSDELISLEIASPDVPDLTLIDLPGITRVAVKGQPADFGDQIKRVIWKFIKKQETIILVVVPCNVDIATTKTLKMAQEVDPDGERTLVILTKPDLVDKGTEQTVVDIVHNKVIPLKKGYMIVRCRSQEEITEDVSLREAMKREKTFFNDHVHFQTLYNEGNATVPKLAERLTLELVNHIEKSLPRLEEQIDEKLAQTHAELKTYCSEPPSDKAEKLDFLIEKVTTFTQDAASLTTGEELKCGNGINILLMLKREFEKWSAHLDHSGKHFNKRVEREVENYEERYRGRELPRTINYKTFEFIVKDQLKQLEEAAVMRLKNIGDAVGKMFTELAESSFTGFPQLMKTAKMGVEDIMKKTESTAESLLRTQFKMELLVYSQDCTYSSSLSDSKSESEHDKDKEKGKPLNEERSVVRSMDSHATLQELMLHLKSYYKIASHHLAHQVPLVIHYQMLQESAVQLQREMMKTFQNEKNVDVFLTQDTDIFKKKLILQSRIDCLTKSHMYLVEF